MAATNPIIYLRAKPIYVDIEAKTYNIDMNKIEAGITNKTKVILAQNTFGLSADLNIIIEIARKYNLWVIEATCAKNIAGFWGKETNF